MGVYTLEEMRGFGELGPKVLANVTVKDVPFDVPFVTEDENEFAFLVNIERECLIKAGKYDHLRVILEQERIEEEEARREVEEEEEEERREAEAQRVKKLMEQGVSTEGA